MKKILITSMVLSLILCSCQPSAPAESDVPGDMPGEESAAETVSEIDESNVLNLFEKGNYSGKTFRVIGANAYNASIAVQQIPDEEGENGNKVNDELYRRDLKLMNHFDIDISYTVQNVDGEIIGIMRNLIQAQDNAYDLVLGSLNDIAWPLAVEGGVRDMNTVSEIDLSAEWWNKYVVDDLGINNKVYMATGDITTRSVTAISGYVFNKPLLESYGIESPYKFVYDGSWTMDVMNGMYKDRAEDLNGDGKYTVDQDFIPLYTGGFINYFAAGGKIIEKGSDGQFALVHNTTQNLDLLAKMIDMFSGGDSAFNVMYPGIVSFMENRNLFMYVAGCDLSLLMEMENDYGFLPFPKGDEKQADYINPANNWIATCAMIPVTVPEADIGFVGTITEAMAALSRYTSMPAQYDELMLTRLIRDRESRDMVQICSETMSFDLGKISGVGGIANIIEDAICLGNEYVSKYASVNEMASGDFAEIIEAIG